MHALIIGTTMSGKTELAKQIARKYREAGINTLHLDPLGDKSWDSEYIFTDPNLFLDVVFKSKSCALFIDESGESIGRYGGEMNKLATRSRHNGHKAFFITQRPSQLDKTVRDNCAEAYIFRISVGDAKLLAEEFGEEELKEANKLGQYEFYHVGRFKHPEKLKLTL